MDIWEAYNKERQLSQREDMKDSLKKLDAAIARLPRPTEELRPAAYDRFIRLLIVSRSPTWTHVRVILGDEFGYIEKPLIRKIEAGPFAIGALREALGRAIPDGDGDVHSAKIWLACLESLVSETVRTQLPTIDEPGQSTTPVSQANGASGRQRSPSGSPVAFRPRYVSPSVTPFDFLQRHTRERSESVKPSPRAGDVARSTKRARAESPSLAPEPKKERRAAPEISPLSKDDDVGVALDGVELTRKVELEDGSSDQEQKDDSGEEEEEEAKEEEKTEEEEEESSDDDEEKDFSDKEAEESSDEEKESVKRMRTRVKRRVVVDSEEDFLPSDNESQAESDTGAGIAEAVRREPSPIVPLPVAPPAGAAPLALAKSPEEVYIRSVFKSIPDHINLAPPPDFQPSLIETSKGFNRSKGDIGGIQQTMANSGTSGRYWYKSRNHLTPSTDANLCAMPSQTSNELQAFKAGSPIVFISNAKKCKEVVDAVAANPGYKKEKPSINVFIKDPNGKADSWRYKGLYTIVHDGTRPSTWEVLPDSAGNGMGQVHEELRKKLKVHTKVGGKVTGEKAQAKLVDWQFAARDWQGAEAELDTRNAAGRQRHLKYLVLACIGFDDESWKVWTKQKTEVPHKIK